MVSLLVFALLALALLALYFFPTLIGYKKRNAASIVRRQVVLSPPRNASRRSSKSRSLGSPSASRLLPFTIYAESFLIAARSLPPATVRFDPARPYLICHSIELGLKAFLSLQGATMLDLADGALGHRLKELLQEADRKGLADSVNLTEAQRSEIRLADAYYSGKAFE